MDDVWQQPIVYDEKDAAAKVANQDDPAESTLTRPSEEPQEQAAKGTEVGGKSEDSFEENLQALADDMEARREQNTHIEVDRELGLAFRNDRDFRWCDHNSATDRLHLDYGGRVQDDGPTPKPGTTVGVDGTIPTSPSYLFPPQNAIWGVPAGEPPMPHTQELAEKDIVGTPVPPVLVPSDGAIVRPAPPTPEQHLVPRMKANRSRLLGGSDIFAGHTARIGDLGALEANFEQLSSERRQHRHDEDGSGFAVARARYRLASFRIARQSILADANSDHGHESNPLQVSGDQHMPSQDGAKAMLGRLKEMRCSVLA